ncbi:MAG: M20/M25/M40 family metallo-hydrolase [Candidatus Cloacimonetes bacterium]|nr:M20/M25/M40 family metallo-hydrolase [Candidatus Cloacimonadota bacterium]
MKDNIVDYFMQMVRIGSESGNEREFAAFITDELLHLGADVTIDGFSNSSHGCSGNIYAYFSGRIELEPLLFCCHIDTVKPGIDIDPYVEDGVIKSRGNTILGSDDKSGIVELLFAIHNLRLSGFDMPPLEILFTSCEEIGLLGAKYFDSSILKSKYGFALDSMEVGNIIIGAPAQNTLNFEFIGKTAHAGFEPEKGVNAIKVAAHALDEIQVGRIDEETTINFGVILGGYANNIVPDKVIVSGEIRSHSEEKLETLTNQVINKAKAAVEEFPKADMIYDVTREYNSFLLDENNFYLKLAAQAFKNIGISPQLLKSGGGSDANILNKDGIQMAVIGTGMDKVHTVDEQIKVRDLEVISVWIEELINLYGNSKRGLDA